jgi:uncharacterized protein (DUF1778 family)
MALAQRAESHAAKPPRKKRPSGASNVINLRTDEATRRLIDSAASALGQNRTDFMLMTARVRAQEVLLSQTHFVLSDAEWADFQAALEAPPVPTAELVALMASTPPWGK